MRTMKTIFNGIGYIAIMLGFVICVGAGGNSDIGLPMSQVMPFLFKGLAMLLLGAILAGWDR